LLQPIFPMTKFRQSTPRAWTNGGAQPPDGCPEQDLDPDRRFDLAYGPAHRFALAALRREGYRSENRITVFQTLVHTLGTSAADVQILLKAHNERNLAEYQGRMEINENLLVDLIRCTKTIEAAVAKLDPPATN
jgi:hypothetical protein